MDTQEALIRYCNYFETLRPSTVCALRELANPDIYFEDPFHAVIGIDSVEKVFAKSFKLFSESQFKILAAVNYSDRQRMCAFIKWQFDAQYKTSGELTIYGVSDIEFDAAGLVLRHVDYWDPAKYVYQNIPVLGAFFRFLARRAAVA